MGGWFGQLGQGLWGDRPAQDPLLEAEQAVNRLVEQLQGDLLSLRQAVAEAIALQKRTERQRHQIQGQVDHWRHQAQDALARGQEDAARAALEQQWPHRQQLKQIEELLAQRRSLVQQLRQTLGKVEGQVLAARNQRDLFVVRSRSAAATLRLRETLDTVAGEGARILEKFETQVQILEAQAELLQWGTVGDPKGDIDEAAITTALKALQTAPPAADDDPTGAT